MLEILAMYAMFWFVDRSVRQLGRDIADEYRKITGQFKGKRKAKHPTSDKPPWTWRAGVKTAAVLGAGTVGAGRGGKHFVTGFKDRWAESRRLAKANRDENRRRQVQPPNDTKPGVPRRLSQPLPDRAPAGDTCAVAGCRLTPVLPSTGRCFDHSDDEARVAWLKDHEPSASASKVSLVKEPPVAEPWLKDYSADAQVEIRAGRCGWPMTGWDTNPEKFCGNSRVPDGPYCPEHTAKLTQIENSNPFNTTNPPSAGGTVTEGVTYGQMISNCETHLKEATGEIEGARVREREANLAFEDAQASVKLAEEETTRIEADAAALMSLNAPADMMARVTEVQEATHNQKQAAEDALAAAEQQKNATAARMASAERKHAAVQALLEEIQRYKTAVDAIDGLGGPQGVPNVEWMTHG